MSQTALFKWRLANGKNLREVATALGIEGNNPGRTLQRYETGARACPLDLAIAIDRLTDGSVTPSDMVEARTVFLHHGTPLTPTDHRNDASGLATRPVQPDGIGAQERAR